jgi:hypothetical protein
VVDYYDDKRVVIEEVTLRKQYGVWTVNAWIKKKVAVSYGEMILYERSIIEQPTLEAALKFVDKVYKDGK